jgi:hypothetical protein
VTERFQWNMKWRLKVVSEKDIGMPKIIIGSIEWNIIQEFKNWDIRFPRNEQRSTSGVKRNPKGGWWWPKAKTSAVTEENNAGNLLLIWTESVWDRFQREQKEQGMAKIDWIVTPESSNQRFTHEPPWSALKTNLDGLPNHWTATKSVSSRTKMQCARKHRQSPILLQPDSESRIRHRRGNA